MADIMRHARRSPDQRHHANALAILCPSSTTAAAGVTAEKIFRGDTTSGGLRAAASNARRTHEWFSDPRWKGPAAAAPRPDACSGPAFRLACCEDPSACCPRHRRRGLRQDHAARRLLGADAVADAVV